jgi:prespore-specific regulator
LGSLFHFVPLIHVRITKVSKFFLSIDSNSCKFLFTETKNSIKLTIFVHASTSKKEKRELRVMKQRQDAWTEEDDLLLAETVLRHVREGSTQLNAFEEVGDKLNRTSAACGFRWNAVVRRRYEQALQLAKRQRKERQRLLGKQQSGRKKLLYNPPVPSLEEIGEIAQLPAVVPSSNETAAMTLDQVIAFLQTFKTVNLNHEALAKENERLRKENEEMRAKNEELEKKIAKLEENSSTIQEDYEALVKIINRARKLVLQEEEERQTLKFRMDQNGNLEKIAE